MRTPNEVFKEMCPCHDEAWVLSNGQWRCIRKDKQGNRYEDSSRSVPLPVVEMAMATNLAWFLFHSLTGEVEALVTKQLQAKIVAARTSDQIAQEHQRVEEMKAMQQREVKGFIKHMFERAGMTVELAGTIMGGPPEPEKKDVPKEELN